MATVIRIKENEKTANMFDLLQNTIYYGLDKPEIVRALLAEKTWEIKNQNRPFGLDNETKLKIRKAYQSYKDGKVIEVKNENLEDFLENLANNI
jgi:hypothetical protein